jgi:hypothetical protein
LAPAELPTGAGVAVRLIVPAAFHALTVRGTDTALAEQLAEVAEELFAADGSAQRRREWAVQTAGLADDIAAAGIRFAGLAAVRAGDRPSDAALIVGFEHRPTPITELAAWLATARPYAEVWTVLLPAGPAVVLVAARTVAVPARTAAAGPPRRVTVSAVEAFVPLPDGVSLLTVQLSTAVGADWQLYTGVFAELLRSLEFGWDGVAGAAEPSVPPYRGAPLDTVPPDHEPLDTAPPDQEPLDPFGTVTAPPPPAAPNPEPRPTPPAAAQPFPPAKGTPVLIPPPDFDPFA